MAELSERLTEALSAFEELADACTPEEAHGRLDEASLQLFWKRWPDVSSWAGALWRRLNEELAAAATPPRNPEDEVGGGD